MGERYVLPFLVDLIIMIHTEWSDDAFPQYSHPYFVKQVAEKYSDLKIICSHTWSGKEEIAMYWLKELDNVYFDFSAFLMSDKLRQMYPMCEFRKLEQASIALRKIYDLVPDRVLFGSDYGECEIKDHMELALKTFKEEELKDVLYENLKKLLRVS